MPGFSYLVTSSFLGLRPLNLRLVLPAKARIQSLFVHPVIAISVAAQSPGGIKLVIFPFYDPLSFQQLGG